MTEPEWNTSVDPQKMLDWLSKGERLSERKARLLNQLELQLEELEATASEDELAAEQAAAKTTQVKAFTRAKPRAKPRETNITPPSAATSST